MSDITQSEQSQMHEGAGDPGAKDLENYEKLLDQTKNKFKVLEAEASETESARGERKQEVTSDEFLRNFFIKFGMKRSLDSFQ